MNHKLRALVLQHLSKGPRAGYGLIKDIHEHTGWKPSYGSIYPLLDQLRKEGLVKRTPTKKGAKKKIYTITEKGKEQLKSLRQHAKEAIAEVNKLHRTVMHICGVKNVDLQVEEMLTRLINPDPEVKLIVKKSYEMKLEFARILRSDAYKRHNKRIVELMDGITKELKKIE